MSTIYLFRYAKIVFIKVLIVLRCHQTYNPRICLAFSFARQMFLHLFLSQTVIHFLSETPTHVVVEDAEKRKNGEEEEDKV